MMGDCVTKSKRGRIKLKGLRKQEVSNLKQLGHISSNRVQSRYYPSKSHDTSYLALIGVPLTCIAAAEFEARAGLAFL